MRILTNISKAELNYLVNQPTAKALIQKVKREGIYIPAGDVQGAAAFVSVRGRQKRDDSAKKESGFAKGLEEDYKRIESVLNNDEVSIEDKVKAYDRFVNEAGVNASGREIERIKKQFDAETLMMARIMFQGHNRLDNIMNGNKNYSQIGTEFIKSFLL